jgi:outer membrane receptor for monomeric catechols
MVVASTNQNAGKTLNPAHSIEHEFGIKTELLSGALLSAALYRLEIGSTVIDDWSNTGWMARIEVRFIKTWTLTSLMILSRF